MIASATLLLFLAGLFFCLITGYSLVYALLFGLLCFILYARYQKISFGEIFQLLLIGLKKSSNILMIFVLISFLTALWRACGTIPFIVYYGLKIINPKFFIMSVFLLCSFVSFLMGTAFGTASTVGVICMIIATINHIHPVITAGAVLSGIFFGDRCSPMSSSASLVAALTETNLYINIKHMFLTSVLPFAATCLIYFLLGNGVSVTGSADFITGEFPKLFRLDWFVVLPAAVILILCCFRMEVKKVMAVSAALSFLFCVFVQGIPASETIRYMITGFSPASDSPLVPLIRGGGLLSMVQVGLIVSISSSYLGLLDRTGLLTNLQKAIACLSSKLGIFPSACAASLITSAFSCNQTLATMLTYELCRKNYTSNLTLALDLEDSVILLAALIPWSIAASAPLAMIEAGTESIFFAFYLVLVPLCRMVFKGRRMDGLGRPCTEG